MFEYIYINDTRKIKYENNIRCINRNKNPSDFNKSIDWNSGRSRKKERANETKQNKTNRYYLCSRSVVTTQLVRKPYLKIQN